MQSKSSANFTIAWKAQTLSIDIKKQTDRQQCSLRLWRRKYTLKLEREGREAAWAYKLTLLFPSLQNFTKLILNSPSTTILNIGLRGTLNIVCENREASCFRMVHGQWSRPIKKSIERFFYLYKYMGKKSKCRTYHKAFSLVHGTYNWGRRRGDSREVRKCFRL